MALSTRTKTVIGGIAGTAVAFSGLGSAQLFGPPGEPLHVEWSRHRSGPAPAIDGTMQFRAIVAIVSLQVETIGAVTSDKFAVVKIGRLDSLVAEASRATVPTRADTVLWNIRIHRKGRGPCADPKVSVLTFCWAAGDTLRLSPPPGATAIAVTHWLVVPGTEQPDSDILAGRRTFWRGVGTVVALLGIVLIWISLPDKKQEPLDEKEYMERVIASVDSGNDELTNQWRQILRWMLVARLDDRLNPQVAKVYKVSSLKAGSLITGALIDFVNRDQRLQAKINQALQEFRQAAAKATELRARRAEEDEAAARRAKDAKDAKDAEDAADDGPAGDG